MITKHIVCPFAGVIVVEYVDDNGIREMKTVPYHPEKLEFPPPMPAGVQVVIDAVEALLAQSEQQAEEKSRPVRFREYL